MSEQGYTYGRVVWRELRTWDAAKVRPFYAELFGWTYQDGYTLIHVHLVALAGALRGGRRSGGWAAEPVRSGRSVGPGAHRPCRHARMLPGY
jgi:predicted enzyme related to lactoylglutathione lyase